MSQRSTSELRPAPRTLAAHLVAAAGFLSPYLNGPLPYIRRYITVNKMC